MRAVEPREQGAVTRGGVRVGYEVFGEGATTIVFTPVDLIVHSRIWKGQVPFLARHFQVVTIDPRGNGRSDRPADPAAHGTREYAADVIAAVRGPAPGPGLGGCRVRPGGPGEHTAARGQGPRCRDVHRCPRLG